MPLSFYRIVCLTCERVISDGWPKDAPPELLVTSRHICRACEEDEADIVAAEARRRREGASA